MHVVEKLRMWSTPKDQPFPTPIGWTCIDRFEIGRFGIFMDFSRLTETGFETRHSYHMFVPGKPNESDCKSYIETIYKGCVDFIKFINEEQVSV